MTGYSWFWLAWGVAALVVEGVALAKKDRPNKLRTLSANLIWLIRGAGPWHRVFRVGLLLFLVWLIAHLFTGGWF